MNRKEEKMLHRVVFVPGFIAAGHPGASIWRVDRLDLGGVRNSKTFNSRRRAEEYLSSRGAEYRPETGKWHGGDFS